MSTALAFRATKRDAGENGELAQAIERTKNEKVDEETHRRSEEGQKGGQSGAPKEVHVGVYEWKASADQAAGNDRRNGLRRIYQPKRRPDMATSKWDVGRHKNGRGRKLLMVAFPI